MTDPGYLAGLLTALGVGLMIGVVRERRHEPHVTQAGTRTHALVALLGYVVWGLGTWPFVATLVVLGALVIRGYQATAPADPGQTGEVALLLTLMLAAQAHQDPALAAGLGVLAAVLLYAKQASQHISRVLIREQELRDGLMLAAAALVVMPLLSDQAVDPWGALRPTTLWRIVVLVMAVGMFGHVARRALGERWGMPVAGFFSGFVSSTAAVASLGQRVRAGQTKALPAAAAALLANLASLLLLAGVVGAAGPALLEGMRWPLALAALALLLAALPGLRRGDAATADDASVRAFKLSHALLLAGVIALMSLLTAWLRQAYGDVSVLLVALGVAWVEVHAAAASLAQLMQNGDMAANLARWGLVAVLASSAVAKTALAWVSGGFQYAVIVGLGMLGMVAAASAGVWWLA